MVTHVKGILEANGWRKVRKVSIMNAKLLEKNFKE